MEIHDGVLDGEDKGLVVVFGVDPTEEHKIMLAQVLQFFEDNVLGRGQVMTFQAWDTPEDAAVLMTRVESQIAKERKKELQGLYQVYVQATNTAPDGRTVKSWEKYGNPLRKDRAEQAMADGKVAGFRRMRMVPAYRELINRIPTEIDGLPDAQ